MASVLILDDDRHMLMSLSDVLQSSGYTVCCASSGQEALKVAQGSSFTFDLVLADVRMEGMDGLQCVKQLVSMYPKLKSIIMTGFASDDAPGRAMDAASSDYLRKPFTADQLLQSVSRVITATEERSGYQRLLNLGKSAVQKVGAASSKLEATREQVFQNYYIGIRAGHLGQTTAGSVWQWLEAAEWDRLNAEKELSLAARADELQSSYEQVMRFCKEATITEMTGSNKERKLSRREFQPFFKNIQSGEISCEQLKLAVYLRSLPPSEIAVSPQLQQLKDKIWNKLTL
jgi:CheY-like chemotaxis protein